MSHLRASTKYSSAFFALCIVLGSAALLEAATATWDPNPEPDIAGYILSYGTQPGQHPTSINVGKVTSKQITLSPGRYYFVVQAYNTSSQTSVPSAEVMFDVVGANNPPTLTQPANQTSAENTGISLALIASDPDGNALTYAATGLPPALGINANTGLISGTLTYTSAGSYTVTATVSDGVLSTSKTFTWTVSNVNRAPVLTQPTNQTSAENTSISLPLAGSDPDGGTFTYSATGLPAALGVNTGTGVIAGTLTSTSAGIYTVTATVSDGALTNSKTFTWTVTDVVPPAPSVSSLSPTSGVAGAAVTISGTNFGATQGTSSVTINGMVAAPTSWSATAIQVTVPAGATTGPVVVTANGVASNGVGFSVLPSAGTITLRQQASLDTLGPTATLAFPSANTAGNFIAVVIRGFQTNQTFTVSDTRGNLYRPALKLINAYPGGSTSGDTVGVFYAENIGPGSNTVTVTVSGTASLRFMLLEYAGVAATSALDGTVSAAQQSSSPASGSLTTTANGDLLLAIVSTQSGQTITPGSGFRAQAALPAAPLSTVMVGDRIQPTAGAVAATATLSASDRWAAGLVAFKGAVGASPNNPPTLTQPASQTSAENASIALPLVASDPDGGVLTYSATGLPAALSVNASSGLISGTLTYASSGSYTVTATVSDGALSNSKTFTWTVNNVNRPPVLTQPVNQTSTESASTSLALVASDPDGGALTYSASGLPAALSVNAATGVIAGTLTSSSAGAYTVTAGVSDGALTSTKTFTWTVTDVGQSPVLTQPTNQTSAENASISLPLVASDPDGGTLTYSVTGLPPALSVNATTGVIAGTLTTTSAGTYSVTATASDGTLSNSKTFTWTVTDVAPTAPTVSSMSPTSGAVGTPVTISGANFGAAQGSSVIRFNGIVAAPTSWSATTIQVTVPSGATTGPVVVTVNGVSSSGVTFTVNPAGTLPAPWLSQDVGGPALSGQATYSAGTFSVTGAGVDIWGTSDQFRFVYQTLDGDGAITARVSGLQNTNVWTKAGVMVREDLTSNAPNAVAQVTSGHGMTFQWRGSRGGVSSSTSAQVIPGVAPYWVRVVRSGNTLSGYHSPDGSTWALMGTATMTLPLRVYVGVAVTSHDAAARALATFTNVTVSSGAAPQSLSSQGATVAPSTSQTTEEGSTLLRRRSPADFDGDGISDITMLRPTTGVWSSLTSSTGFTNALQLTGGLATDIPVPGDFDGDGQTDVATFRPSTGVWDIWWSATGYVDHVTTQWGAQGDRPVQADYDGDGKTDIAIFRPSTGSWHIQQSSTATNIMYEWGTSTDRPVVGDYDGDRRADLAVYRAATGSWNILLSSTSFKQSFSVVLGSSDAIPTPGDYDGDGKTDPAIFSATTGTWSILKSSTGFRGSVLDIPWGQIGDIPVTADYDGDGVTDLAVFRALENTWYILKSSSGFKTSITQVWGSSLDVPLPRTP